MSEANYHGPSHTLVASEADFPVDPQDIRLDFRGDIGSHVSIVRRAGISKGAGSFTQGTPAPEQSSRSEGGRQIFGNISSHGGDHTDNFGAVPGSTIIAIPEDCRTIANLDLSHAASVDFPDDLTFGRFYVKGTSNDVNVNKPLKSKILSWTTTGGNLDFQQCVESVRASLNTMRGALSVNGLKSKHARLTTTGGDLTVKGEVRIPNDATMTSARGALTVGDVEGGKLVFETTGGEVTIGNVNAQYLEVASARGNTSLGQVGSEIATMTTTGGALDVAGLFVTSAQASTARGNITFGPSSITSAKINTTGGSVTCMEINDIQTLMIESARGDVNANMDFPLSGSIKTTGGAVNARFCGDPGGTLAIESARGAVNAVFEPEDSENPESSTGFGGRLEILAGRGGICIDGDQYSSPFKGTVGDHASTVTIGTTGGTVDIKWHDTSSRQTAYREAAWPPTAPTLTQSEMWEESDTVNTKVYTPETSDDEGEPDIPLPEQAPTVEGPLPIEPEVSLPYQQPTVESDDE